MHELPLVFFTVFAQMAAGTILITSLYALCSTNESTQNKIQKANLFAFFMMLIGMGAAFFHLGQPLRAFNVIFGLGRSPMSNEIMIFSTLAGLTFVTIIVSMIQQRNQQGNSFLHKPILMRCLSFLLIVFSLLTAWAIVLVYQIDTVPTWNTSFTALQLFATFFILGGAVTILFGFRFWAMVSFLIGLATVLATKLSYITFLNHLYPELTQAQYPFWIIQVCLLMFSLVMIVWLMFRKNRQWYALFLVLIFAVIAELSCRIAFYNLWHIPMS